MQPEGTIQRSQAPAAMVMEVLPLPVPQVTLIGHLPRGA